MLTRRFSLMAVAAAFAVSSSAAMLQSARPALADADDHHPRAHQRVAGDHDRDDRRAHPPANQWRSSQHGNTWHNTGNNGRHWANGQWVSNGRNANPGKHNGWKHKKNHDRDHDGDRR